MFSAKININEINNYDSILLETLNHLREKWHNPETGIVACCLIDGDKKAFATSRKNGTFWTHAERNAYNEFLKKYNTNPSSAAVFVVTLSPCMNGLKHRQEDSCSDLLKQLSVKRAHFGVLDTMHAETLDAYRSIGLIPSLSHHDACKMMCHKLMGLFAKYDSRINYDLLGIKRELGEEFFNEIDATQQISQIPRAKL